MTTFTQENSVTSINDANGVNPLENMTDGQKKQMLKALLLETQGTTLKAEVEAEISDEFSVKIAKLEGRNEKLNAEIEGRNEEILANILRIKALGGKATAAGSRTRVTCAECGQKSHMPNAKTSACSLGAWPVGHAPQSH